ncbi:tetratricopeptide repeat protein [bacterium]|nr:tetratricopeptide repeat protein [bacterium]
MSGSKRIANQLLKQGRLLVLQNDLEGALEKFKASVDEFPTAEGYTNWAWMLSFSGDLNRCITLCEKAIELDPEFGNAYNDIGSYLIDLDRCEEAIPWLKKAKRAKKYDARHFPFLNLARAYLKLDRDKEALTEYKRLLKLDPNNIEALFILEYLGKPDEPSRFSRLFSDN